MAERFRELTGRNLNQQLAMLVEGRVFAAPRIRGEISSRAVMTGRFSGAQLRRIQAAFTGLVDVAQPQQKASDAAGDGPTASGAETRLRDAALAAQSRNNLKQIAIALHNFHDVHGKFPGSTNRREGSHPRAQGEVQPFSWRVAIPPFIGQNQLFEDYRFDQPWDDPDNIKLLERMPEIYRSPLATPERAETPAGHTHYQGLVGPRTALGDADGQRMRTFTDGTSNTVLIVESLAAVPWTKPEDIPFESLDDARRVKPFPDQPLQFITADGAARVMDPVDYAKLGKMITRDGGEVIPDSWPDESARK